MRKAGIILVAAAVAAVFAGTSLAEGLRVAVIDVNKILNDSAAGQAAKKKMEVRYEELKKTIDAKQEEARKIKEEIDKQKVMVGKEKLKEKEDALQAKLNELRQLTQEGEREMQTRQGEFTREVLKSVEAKVDVVVKADKLDLVLEKSAGVVHYNDSLDITQRVLNLVDADSKPAPEKKAAPERGEKAAPEKKAAPGRSEVTVGSKILLSVLAGKIGALLQGPDVEVSGIAGVDEAGPGQVTFLSNPKYARQARETKASAIIAKQPIAGAGCAFLLTPDPYLAFALAVEQFHSPVRPAAGVSAQASVHPTAVLGKEVTSAPSPSSPRERSSGTGSRCTPGRTSGRAPSSARTPFSTRTSLSTKACGSGSGRSCTQVA